MHRLISIAIGLLVLFLLLALYGYLQAREQCEDHAYKNGVVTWFSDMTCYEEDDRGNLYPLKWTN